MGEGGGGIGEGRRKEEERIAERGFHTLFYFRTP